MKEIENLIQEKIETIEPLYVGLTNDHFLVNHTFFVRVEKKNGRKDVTPIDEMLIEEKYGTLFHPSFPTLYFDPINNIKISLYEPNFTEFSKDTASKKDYVEIATLLYQLHHIKEGLDEISSFHPLKRIDLYRKEAGIKKHPLEKWIKENFPFFYEECAICHHDIVQGNLLKIHDHIELIDFEYVGKDDPFFDLASFISENNIRDKNKILFFLENYFKREPNENELIKFSYFLKLNDLMWYYWALMMKRKTGQEVYQEIAKEKEEHLRSPFL